MAKLHTVWNINKKYSQISNKKIKSISSKNGINNIKDKLFSYNSYIHMK